MSGFRPLRDPDHRPALAAVVVVAVFVVTLVIVTSMAQHFL